MIRIVMDSQLRTALELCPTYMNLRHNLDLVPIGGIGKGIEQGSMTHRMLEVYYLCKRENMHPDDCLAQAISVGNLFITGCQFCIANICEVHKDKFLGLESVDIDDAYWVLESFKQYHQRWRNDSWTTIEVETVKGRVIYEDDNISLLWKAKIDWLIDNIEGIFSVDHKTMSRMDYQDTTLNNQFMGQAVLTNQNKMFLNKFGFQKSLKPEEKFIRQAVNFSDERKAEWILESAGYAYDLIEIEKNQRYQHRWSSCKRQYGLCMYHRCCEGQPNDRERILKEYFKVSDRKWDIGND